MTSCDHCGMIFKFPSQLERHLSRKYPCFTNLPPQTNNKCIEQNELYTGQDVYDSEQNIKDEYKCSKCNKCLSTKAYLKKHETKCNGLNSLQCPKCLKKFSDSSAKCKHIKNVKCKPSEISYQQVVDEQPHKQSVYLLIEREFLILKENVFKIGRSENVSNRAKQYPNGSQLLIVLPCIDCKVSEKQLKEVFRTSFKHRTDIGSEYFEGSPNMMIRTFINNVEARF